MKYFILAGEASGDLHGANLVKAIFEQDKNAEIQAWGGDQMSAAGANIVKHIDELAFMGFAEVISNLPTILRNFSLCKSQIEKFNPDRLILIDYPGFNLRMCKWAKQKGFHMTYYIAPQAWAWKAKRVEILKKNVDQLIVILPFEQKWFADRGMPNNYYGHPLMDTNIMKPVEEKDFLKKNNLSQKPIIALLPGSRSQELKRMEKIFLTVVKKFPAYQFVVAGAPNQNTRAYKNYIDQHIPVLFDATYPLLKTAKAALVTSGTATLETAIIETPMIVCYKASLGTYWIAKSLIQIPYISLVNLIAGKKIVPELIQSDCTPENIGVELGQLLIRTDQKEALKKLKEGLGKPGVSMSVAKQIINF